VIGSPQIWGIQSTGSTSAAGALFMAKNDCALNEGQPVFYVIIETNMSICSINFF
jgi:hypothetical protein